MFHAKPDERQANWCVQARLSTGTEKRWFSRNTLHVIEQSTCHEVSAVASPDARMLKEFPARLENFSRCESEETRRPAAYRLLSRSASVHNSTMRGGDHDRDPTDSLPD
jgi:hypothetical protein